MPKCAAVKVKKNQWKRRGNRSNPVGNASRCRLYRLRKKLVQEEASLSVTESTMSSNVVATAQIPMDFEVEYNNSTVGLSTDNDVLTTRARIFTAAREADVTECWTAADIYFTKTFVSNEFGHACDVCDRLWFQLDLKNVQNRHHNALRSAFPEMSIESFKVCSMCKRSLDKGKLPTMSITNGFRYPTKPTHLSPLDPITERLISPRLPFMQIRRLRYDGNYSIVGQVINVPVDVNNMVQQLPRSLDNDQTFNVNIKKHLIHKSTYLRGFVRKAVVKEWLRYLVCQPLYKRYNITVDFAALGDDVSTSAPEDIIETMTDLESEVLVSRQHTMVWNEEQCLDIAPGQHKTPMNIIYDAHAEELSFPAIYYGVPRQFNLDVRVTPYMMATSEIRRSDRRGVTPQHILYMAMKILRLRVVDGIYNTFRCVSRSEGITRRMLEDRQFLDECIEKNLAFLKSIPNSVNYWAEKKRDLFAMIRQLGKPTMFLTLSASEIRWPKLLALLHKLSDIYKEVNAVDNLTRSMRCHLVNEDPVTCCIYFNKLVNVIMSMLQSRQRYNPFGSYRVIDYFQRIEFQHRGSPHAHILLWLQGDPKEVISEDMPETVRLVDKLCSVSSDDLPGDLYGNQVHKHTFTCTKRGEATCRFNIPYWPMDRTRVIIPMPKDDNRRKFMQTIAVKLRKCLDEKSYGSLGEFLIDNELTVEKYLSVIRATLKRPTLIFRREMSHIYTNTFNPWLSRTMASNIDLQFILDEYSCAAYVVDYVNKSNRGMSHLQRELTIIQERYPDEDYTQLLKRISLKLLNTVEMSAPEAAWYLLRQPMSVASRKVSYIPTVWPQERQKARKCKAQMDRERLEEDSTDVWTKSIIERYEDRPAELESLCLADFVGWYTNKRETRNAIYDDCEDGDDELAPPAISARYKKRDCCRIIRYRQYDLNDMVNYKREMVTLYMPFRNEITDVLDTQKFKHLYDTNEAMIMAKRKEYESNIDIARVMEEIERLCVSTEDDDALCNERRTEFVTSVLQSGQTENIDDFNAVGESCGGISAVRRRTNIMTKQSYCNLMRTTNKCQRELILEVIHRLHAPESRPLQIFLTGPAGCGKTYVLKALMETYNRYTVQHNSMRNAYVACASTGKAAVNLGGTTVHSAFRITQSRRRGTLASEVIQTYRNAFVGVKCVFIDEVSMIGYDVLNKVNARLQEITGVYEEPFGGMDVVFCGDFRQLPPVNATPVYKAPRNMLGGSVLWQSLQFYPLEQVMRQSNVIFSGLLTKIGNGQRLSSEEMNAIESRFRTVQWCTENKPNAIRLFHRNLSVDAYNANAITTQLEIAAIDMLSGYKDNAQLTSCRLKLHKLSVPECGGLPYLLKLATGIPYMLTINIDIEDGLVNGAIGFLKYIETTQPEDSAVDECFMRLWLAFPDSTTGTRARIKALPRVLSSVGLLSRDWTPISRRQTNVPLGGTVKCRRVQFPLIPACAVTIHKSQGGTFNEVVFEYHKKQQNQLVYVALSRVTSIDGLYLTNEKEDFRFYHGLGNTTPTIREVRDEYLRLENHKLPTLTRTLKCFCDTGFNNVITEYEVALIVASMNVQSIVAHSADIASDAILSRADYLMCNETWMPDDIPVNIQGYALQVSCNSQPSTYVGARRAGGVAIYRSVENTTQCVPVVQQFNHVENKQIGDICMARVSVGSSTFLMVSVYIHPGMPISDIKVFLYRSLCEYRDSIGKDKDMPIMLSGDFNVDVSMNPWLLEYMKNEFGLMQLETPPTTLGNTRIDLTFVRHLNATCIPYVCYFSYHRPMIHRLEFKRSESNNMNCVYLP